MATAEKRSVYHVTIYLSAEHREESISVGMICTCRFRGGSCLSFFKKKIINTSLEEILLLQIGRI